MRWWLVVALCGCKFAPGHYTDDAPGSPGDDVGLDQAASDVLVPDSPAVTGCIAQWLAGTIRFSAPVRLSELGASGEERDPFLRPDELTIYFYSNRTGASGGADVYFSTRSSIGAQFSTPNKFSDVNSNEAETKIALSRDGLYVVASSNRPSGTSFDVWNSRRATTSMPFPALDQLNLGTVNTASDQHDAFITGDGLRLYFAHSSNVQKIALASRATRITDFGTPTILTELDSNTGDADPSLSLDERLIVFASNRTGSGMSGGNMWYATRAGSTGTFGTPAPIPDINSSGNDGDPWVSDDGCRVYFSSDRESGISWEIYVATAL